MDTPLSALVVYILLINTATFLAYACDKHAARKHRPRVRERTLHIMALIGGSPGALIAQQVLRHKTAKRSFQLTYWGIVVAQVAVLVYFWAS
jgi:uncharacterized membrane protein YsdA (DUF1294 family)